jgi:hypothetical protein
MTKKPTDKYGSIRENEIKYFKRGEYLYQKLRVKLEKKYIGKVMAIDPDSGKYIIGKDELDTARKAQEKFPGKPLDYFRIGEEVMHKFR